MSNKHDSTGAMASAWFGTSAPVAVEAVFGKKYVTKAATINCWDEWKDLLSELMTEFPGKGAYIHGLIHRYPVDVKITVSKGTDDGDVSIEIEEIKVDQAIKPEPTEFQGVKQIRPDVWEINHVSDHIGIANYYREKYPQYRSSTIRHVNEYPIVVQATVKGSGDKSCTITFVKV